MTSNSSDPQQNPVPQSVSGGGSTQLPSLSQQAGPPALPFPQTPGPWAGPATDDGINILDYLHSLRRRWLLGLCIGLVLAFFTAVGMWFTVPVTYEAASLLHVKRDPGKAIQLNSRSHIDDNTYQSLKATQIAMIESWHVLQPAIDAKGIRSLPMFRGEDDKVEYLASILQVSYPDNAEMLRISLRGENGNDCKAVVHAVTTSYIDNVVAAADKEDFERLQYLRTKFLELDRNMRELSDDIIRKEAESYSVGSARTEELRDQTRSEMDLLRAQQAENQRQIDSINSEIALWARRLNVPYTPSRIEIELAMRTNERYAIAEANVQAAEDALQATLARSQPGSRFAQRAQSSLVSAEQALQRVYEDLEQTTIDQIRLANGYNPTQIESRLQELGGQVRMLEGRLQSLAEETTSKEENLQLLLDDSTELLVMKAELQRLQETAEVVNREIDFLAMNVGRDKRISLLQEARTENHSDIGFKYLVVMGSSFIVFLLSIVGVTLGDYLGKRVNSTSDVAQNIHLPVVGTLPIVHGGWMSHLVPIGRDNLDLKLQESIDSIRTAIVYNRRPTPVQVVMVTSATSQEGKTTVASQLAVSLARSGRRTLLIDGDFQNPQQHEVFGLGNNTGFCDVLRGEVDPAAAPLATEAEGLWLLTAGYGDRRALQALASPVGREKIDQLKQHFDYIILDSAPVLTGAEALLLGQLADCALVSIRRDISRISKVSGACQRLESVGIDILGGILNGAPSESRRYFQPGIEEEIYEDQDAIVAEVD